MEELHHARELVDLPSCPSSCQYEKRVTDYNFGTLIRRDCEKAYGEDNCILLTRVQFFGIEVSWQVGKLRS